MQSCVERLTLTVTPGVMVYAPHSRCFGDSLILEGKFLWESTKLNLMICRRYVLSQGAGDQDKEELSALVSCSRPEMDIVQDVLSVILR